MLKIGEFSALAQVSIKTLRYYDELGLLSPVRIAPDTGYRYYSASQLPRLHRILALKDQGGAGIQPARRRICSTAPHGRGSADSR